MQFLFIPPSFFLLVNGASTDHATMESLLRQCERAAISAAQADDAAEDDQRASATVSVALGSP